MAEFLSYLITGLLVGMLYSLIAIGFVTIYKTTGVLNLAQGEVFLLGAYAVLFFVDQLGLPTWLGIPAAFAALALVGIFTERFTLRSLVGQPILAIILMTLGLSIFLKGIMTFIWSDLVHPLPQVFGTGEMKIMGTNIATQYVWFFVTAIVFSVGLMLFFRYTKIGLMMTAVADDTQLAQSHGINVNIVTAMAWVIACVVTGAGGFMLCSLTGVSPEFAGMGLRALAVVLAGGMESIGGALIMGPVIGVIEFMAAGYLDQYVGGGIREIAAFVVLIIFLMFRPQGIFGWKIIERV